MRRKTLSRICSLVILTGTVLVSGLSTSQEPVHRHHELSAVDPNDAAAAQSALQAIEPDFELVGRDGRTVRDEDFQGRYVLLGFGFTRCTDVCPLMALNMARVLQAVQRPAAGIFISVDTERDTPEIVDRYTRRFDERIVGLSGSIEQINAAVQNFNARYVVTKTQDAITVQHTSHIYAIDPAGEVIDTFAFMTPAQEIAAALE